ncbi:MAG: 50S ribosomal protein L15 [Candidatus Falkowbacteria bacterium]
MVLSLSSLSSSEGSSKKRKRVGRGNGSGHGTTATRGTKGQKSRSGVTNLKRLGLKKMLLSVPKTRGFKSVYGKNQVVNLEALNEVFKQGDAVNPRTLFKAGLVNHTDGPIKILAQGELKVAALKFSGVIVSKSAAKTIEDNKGTINQ